MRARSPAASSTTTPSRAPPTNPAPKKRRASAKSSASAKTRRPESTTAARFRTRDEGPKPVSDQFMIPLEELRSLATFWADHSDALSLYFQPPAPSELSHREEPILVKENIQQKLNTLRGSSPADREDIRRIL